MKITHLLAATCAAALIPFSAASAATVFDFESVTLGTYSTVTQTVSSLTTTITSQTGSIAVQNQTIPGENGHVLINFNTGSGPMTANFSSIVNGVSITGGDYGMDVDHIFLAAYSGLDGTGTLLGSITGPPCCSDPGGAAASETVNLNVAGIQSIRFYTGAGDQFPGALYFDNLTVDNFRGDLGGIPEPASWAMMLMGFFGLGAMLRNRRRTLAFAT